MFFWILYLFQTLQRVQQTFTGFRMFFMFFFVSFLLVISKHTQFVGFVFFSCKLDNYYRAHKDILNNDQLQRIDCKYGKQFLCVIGRFLCINTNPHTTKQTQGLSIILHVLISIVLPYFTVNLQNITTLCHRAYVKTKDGSIPNSLKKTENNGHIISPQFKRRTTQNIKLIALLCLMPITMCSAVCVLIFRIFF